MGSGCISLLLKEYVSADIDRTLVAKYGKPNTVARFIGIDKSEIANDVACINFSKVDLPLQVTPTRTLSTPYIFNQKK